MAPGMVDGMEGESFFNFGNEAFTLTGYKCVFDVVEDENGRRILTVGIDTSQELHYAFSAEHGLCTTTPFGSPQEKDLLGKFVSLPDNDAEAAFVFFQEYGYLFPLQKDDDVVVDYAVLVEVISRLKATMLLQSLLGETESDYEKILHLTLYLLLSKRVEMKLGTKTVYRSCQFSVADQLESSLMPGLSGADAEEASAKGTYTVRDTLRKPTYEFDSDEYSDIMSGECFRFDYPGITDMRYRRLTAIYKSARQESRNDRIILDFLFHLMHEVGVIKSVTYQKGIEYYGIADTTKFDSAMKTGLINVARIILSQEINHNISQMRPFYSPLKLEGSWRAPSLLTALYFSIFYRNPNTVIYRKCANPSCHNYFSVNTTNGRKKYCCDECRNANNQRTHRLKVKRSRGH